MAMAKRQRREKPVKIEQRKGLKIRVRTSSKTDSPSGYPNLRGGEKNTQKEEPKLSRGFLFSLRLLGRPALASGGCIFLFLPIKLSYNTGLSSLQIFAAERTEEITHSPDNSKSLHLNPRKKK